MAETSGTDPPAPLPQPLHDQPYRYLRGSDIDHVLFREEFQTDQLVWVSTSKGLKKQVQRRQQRRQNGQEDVAEEVMQENRTRLFGRARVVSVSSPDMDRIQVRYPLGSTYHVRPAYLETVLEYESRYILVVPETDAYRHLCVVHTLPDEDLLEIGCDLGRTIERVWETGGVNYAANGDRSKLDQRRVIGIDKSAFSIAECRPRYPHLAESFLEWDAIQGHRSEHSILEELDPSIVAIDINGNRELPAVLACLDAVWNRHVWRPRLILVKSRTLHARLLPDEQPCPLVRSVANTDTAID